VLLGAFVFIPKNTSLVWKKRI